MNINKFLTTVIFFQIIVFTAKAQDPYFSQYFMSPMTNNPALAGRGITETRVLANIRSQWWGTGMPAFRTNSISIEKRVSVKIPGNLLIVDCSEMKNINLTFVNERTDEFLKSKVPAVVYNIFSF